MNIKLVLLCICNSAFLFAANPASKLHLSAAEKAEADKEILRILQRHDLQDSMQDRFGINLQKQHSRNFNKIRRINPGKTRAEVRLERLQNILKNKQQSGGQQPNTQ